MMDCPKCNTEVKTLDYHEESDNEWVLREWECKCPNCGYHGIYRESYKLDVFEWERVR